MNWRKWALVSAIVIVTGCPFEPGAGPIILGFGPTEGRVGTEVTIGGLNFSATAADNTVTIGGVPAEVRSATAVQIVAVVGPGAVTGPVTVTVGGQTATSGGNFTVITGPAITSFAPTEGYQGTLVSIQGDHFSEIRLDNHVTIGTVPAIVVSATKTRIDALVGFGADSGPVTVEVGGVAESSADPFKIIEWPAIGAAENGPPIFYEVPRPSSPGAKRIGRRARDLPSTGTIRVLVVPSYPTDRVPGNLANARADIQAPWDDVHDFYDQSSYGTLDVQVTVANWVTLTGNFEDYYSATHNNIDPAVLDRLTAECAGGAEGQGEDMDDFDAMACVFWCNGTFLRAWGGWSKNNFAYAGNGLNINIAVGHEVNLMALGETANWGRCAHELGHNIVSANAALAEDVYDSDLVDPASATAQVFEMMGAHDDHPLFSGGYIRPMGWYSAANVLEVQWDRNPTSNEYDIAAHRLTQDADASIYHLVRIKITNGLDYYVEVRQRPPAGDAQLFDTDIPIGAAPNNGGVIVTKVITGLLHNNQQIRYITLLQPDERVMLVGETATDPARQLEVEVVSERLVGDRLVCRVRIEWAQELVPDPTSGFDLEIEPWNDDYETPDVWIDRQPWGVYDHTDGAGNPTGNGDKPQPMAINHFWGRVRSTGAATNVRLTYYAIEPPGVGDNGNWVPLSTEIIAAIADGGNQTQFVNWVPTVGRHTCLQLFAEPQAGEVTYANNKAQENVFEFEAPASSPPDPVRIPVAVRNPKKEPTIILIRLVALEAGYIVQFPHHWVYLDALGELTAEMIVIPTRNISEYGQKEFFPLRLILDGIVPRQYADPAGDTRPGSRMLPIGGLTARVTPKYRGQIELDEDPEFQKDPNSIGVRGRITPPYANQSIEVVLRDPLDRTRVERATTNGAAQFTVRFDLTHAPSEDPFEGKPGPEEPPVPGQYKARAFIVNAPKVSEAESNEVLVTR